MTPVTQRFVTKRETTKSQHLCIIVRGSKMDSSMLDLPTALAGSNSTSASFAEDSHVSFDQETGKWRYEADDGKELEYDVIAQAWVPIVCKP